MNEMSALTAAVASQEIRALLPEITARADEIESKARVPLDLLNKLERAGAFRLAVPTSLRGEGLPMSAVAQLIKDVAGADASTAWHMMVAAGTQFITARLPLDSLLSYYGNGPDIWAKAAAAPKGIAVPVEGGFQLTGRWPLASGARDFEWISLGFFIKEDGGLRRAQNGAPDLRICLVPRGDVEVIETWDAVGLRGTRSDDLVVKDLFVPTEWQASFGDPAQLPEGEFSINIPFATGPLHSAIVLGILKAAIEDLAQAALTRRPAFAPTSLMKDDPVFRSRFGELAIKAEALDALADRCIALMEGCNSQKRNVTPAEGAKLLAAEAIIHHDGTQLMDQIMMLAGSGGVYMSNAQQRRWRDLRCVAQHVAANIGNYSAYATSLVGQAEAGGDLLAAA